MKSSKYIEMEKKNKYQFEEALESISRVEASPFILTRIQERIKQTEMAPKSLVWALGLSFLIILAVNIVAFSDYSDYTNKKLSSNSNSTEMIDVLLPQNGLYD